VLAHNLRVFDEKSRIDTGHKKRAATIFSHLNNSAREGCEASRVLIEDWFSHFPADERNELRSRFRSGEDAKFASAFHELCLHELLLRLACGPRQHPAVVNSTKRPDFSVIEPDGFEFLLEARTSTAVSTGPDSDPRRNRVRDFLQEFKVPGFSLGIDELSSGYRDLRLANLRKHIRESVKSSTREDADRIRVPALETDDGWKIRLTAIADTLPEPKKNTVLYEAWGHTWSGPTSPLRDALMEKAGRYGSELAMPFLIALNSFDAVLGTLDFEELLFGKSGLWGTLDNPRYRRVSAILLTKNLWAATLLMGQVEARLYLNPFADRPYRGVLRQMDTFTFECASWRCHAGNSIDQLLKLPLRDSSLWD
jgi:hypothetical protein